MKNLDLKNSEAYENFIKNRVEEIAAGDSKAHEIRNRLGGVERDFMNTLNPEQKEMYFTVEATFNELAAWKEVNAYKQALKDARRCR